MKKSLVLASLLLASSSVIASDKMDVGVQATSLIDTIFVGKSINNLRYEGHLSYLKVGSTKGYIYGVGLFYEKKQTNNVTVYAGARYSLIEGREDGESERITMFTPTIGVDYYPVPEISYGIEAGLYNIAENGIGNDIAGIKTGFNFKYHF